jgi:hypothetical protein
MYSQYFFPFLPHIDEASQWQQQHPQRSLTKGKPRTLIVNLHIQILYYTVISVQISKSFCPTKDKAIDNHQFWSVIVQEASVKIQTKGTQIHTSPWHHQVC